MGFFRLMYRRKHILFFLLCATTCWLLYHIFYFSSDQVVHDQTSKHAISFQTNHISVQDTVRKATDVKHEAKESGVLQPPPRNEDVQPLTRKDDAKSKDVQRKEDAKPPERKEDVQPSEGKKYSPQQQQKDSSKLDAKKTDKSDGRNTMASLTAAPLKKGDSKIQDEKNVSKKAQPKGEGHLDTMLKIGEKLKNKTLDLGEKMKNKTIEKLSQLGVIKSSNPLRYVFVPDVWKLKLTLDDLSQVMKDTDHLSKQEKIDVNYPKLVHVKSNLTEGNLTVALRKVVMENPVGFCDCKDYECMCCSRVTHKRIQVNLTACANVTFMSKSQELNFKFSMDNRTVYQKQIAVEPAPKICLGSHSKVADICVNFLNTTSKVTVLEDHKFLVVGCLEFSISLFNKTVSAFPVDCFQMPSHQHHQKEEGEKKMAQDLGNWMP